MTTASEAFRTRWAAHNVRFHNNLAADHGLALFTARPRFRLPAYALRSNPLGRVAQRPSGSRRGGD